MRRKIRFRRIEGVRGLESCKVVVREWGSRDTHLGEAGLANGKVGRWPRQRELTVVKFIQSRNKEAGG